MDLTVQVGVCADSAEPDWDSLSLSALPLLSLCLSQNKLKKKMFEKGSEVLQLIWLLFYYIRIESHFEK